MANLSDLIRDEPEEESGSCIKSVMEFLLSDRSITKKDNVTYGPDILGKDVQSRPSSLTGSRPK